MGLKRVIYSILLAVIYITATSMSSISILTCDHHHHSTEHHEPSCCHDHHNCDCDNPTIAEDCCDHHHPILGDNHTDFIASSERNDSRASQLLALILSPAVIGEGEITEAAYSITLNSAPHGDKATPLLAAIHETRGLRAPPALC